MNFRGLVAVSNRPHDWILMHDAKEKVDYIGGSWEEIVKGGNLLLVKSSELVIPD